MKINVTVTGKNLEAAFAGESMAFMKYSYFAKVARAMGDEATAAAFEETAKQEIQHAFGHLDILYPKETLTPANMLETAIAGETYEYTEMYPGFRATAEAEGNAAAVAEMRMRVVDCRCAMRCPAGVGNACEALHASGHVNHEWRQIGPAHVATQRPDVLVHPT